MHRNTIKLLRVLLTTFLSILFCGVVAQDSLINLEKSLQETGWSVQRTTSGDILLMLSEQPQDAKQPEAPTMDMEKLTTELENSGWKVRREENGSLLLNTWAPSQQSDSELNKANSIQDIQQKLRDAGWRVVNNTDGSILLFQPRQTHSKLFPSCAGVAPSINVSLPIDSWLKAHDLAQAWLKEKSIQGVAVGKIRKILKIYLVSIVADKPPHLLRQQLAIRDSDGAIIVLN